MFSIPSILILTQEIFNAMSGFPPIEGIFYSEFHPVQGPKIVYEIPEGFSAELSVDFDSFSEYIIPKSALCNRLVSIRTTKYQIMGFPVRINDSKYQRNAFLFNLCFVFDKQANTRCYDQIVSKIARVLVSLETQTQYLSAQRGSLKHSLAQIMEDLNSYHECQIMMDNVNTLDLKLFPLHQEPPRVCDHQVPIFVSDVKSHVEKHWDLTIQKVIPFIDGVCSVDLISRKAGLDSIFTRLAIQHLLYYGCIHLLDIFQFGNVYATTGGLSALITDKEMQQQCLPFVARIHREPLSLGVIVTLFAALKGSMTVLEWMREHPSFTSQIDIR
jgi:nitrogen permease regulator 2-like protein